MLSWQHPALVAAATAVAGCGALLGVEDVALEGDGGGSGEGGAPAGDGGGRSLFPTGVATGDGGAGSTAGQGTGNTGAASSADASTAVATVSASASSGAAATSTGAGGGCTGPLPPCPGAQPADFDGPDGLDAGWVVESPKVKIGGKKLQLDPETDEATAAVRSVAPVLGSGSCAIWVSRQDGHDGITRMALVAADGTESAALARGDGSVTASVGGAPVASVPADDGEARHLRIRLEPDGTHLDVSGDATCWWSVAGPVAVGTAGGVVRLVYTGRGKAKLDDYCLP